MSRIRNRILSLSYFHVFLLITTVFMTVFFILNLVLHGDPIDALTIEGSVRYNDYYLHMSYASAPVGTNIYELSANACFPPLAYLLYGFLARIGGFQAEKYVSVTDYQFFGHNSMIFLMYNIICSALLIYAVSLYFKKKNFLSLVFLPVLLLLSYPFAFTSIHRGNSIFLTASLIAIALAWKDDASKIKREAAMILIAICAGLKIYPAVLGLLYLREKRWKETVRLFIYGIVLFFVPFAFFGGFDAIKTFFTTIFSLYGDVHICSVSGVVTELVKNAFGEKAALFATIVQQLFLILSLTAFFIVRNNWQRILILCGLMAVYISSNWMYTCIYFLPPMLMFFKEQDDRPLRINKTNWSDLIPFVLFTVSFTVPFYYGYETLYPIFVGLILLYVITAIVQFSYKKLKAVYLNM